MAELGYADSSRCLSGTSLTFSKINDNKMREKKLHLIPKLFGFANTRNDFIVLFWKKNKTIQRLNLSDKLFGNKKSLWRIRLKKL